MRNDDIAENVLQIGKEGVRQNIAEALNEFCEEFADEMWKAAEEVIKLRAENAALRERLEKSVERLKTREKSVCLGTEWKAVVTDEDIDEVFGIAEARLAELKGDSGGKNADKT